MTGLEVKHVDLDNIYIRIDQRNWRGDIDEPKTAKSKRVLALGDLNEPMWDSGVPQALKRAATAEGCDFPGFGPHSLRCANITWRQEVGGSSIEASKIARSPATPTRRSRRSTRLSDCPVEAARRIKLTPRIQNRRAKAGRKANEKKILQMKKESAA